MESVKFTYRIYDNFLEITPVDGIEDNAVYDITIKNLKSEDHHLEAENIKKKITTAMTPCYCSINDVKVMVDILNIPDSTILYLIRDASRQADFINGAPIDVSHGIPFEVSKYTAVKATLMALGRAYLESADKSGLEGTVGKISFKNGTKVSDINTLISRYRTEEHTWQEAIRGYVFEGRNVSKFALRGDKTIWATPTRKILNDYTRDGNMGWRRN